jgi:hypothetical protein
MFRALIRNLFDRYRRPSRASDSRYSPMPAEDLRHTLKNLNSITLDTFHGQLVLRLADEEDHLRGLQSLLSAVTYDPDATDYYIYIEECTDAFAYATREVLAPPDFFVAALWYGYVETKQRIRLLTTNIRALSLVIRARLGATRVRPIFSSHVMSERTFLLLHGEHPPHLLLHQAPLCAWCPLGGCPA